MSFVGSGDPGGGWQGGGAPGRDGTPTPSDQETITAVTLGGNAASPTGRRSIDPGASIVTETNVSPEIFAENQPHVDLDADLSQVSSPCQSAGHQL
jgi:hypothetical protein